jgi:hypothetical protein
MQPEVQGPGHPRHTLLNHFHDVAYLAVHLKHTYPVKDKPDISLKISAA